MTMFILDTARVRINSLCDSACVYTTYLKEQDEENW